MRGVMLYILSTLLMLVLCIPFIAALQWVGIPSEVRSLFCLGFGMFVTLWIFEKLYWRRP